MSCKFQKGQFWNSGDKGTKRSACYSSDCMLQLFPKIISNRNLNKCFILKRQKQNKQEKWKVRYFMFRKEEWECCAQNDFSVQFLASQLFFQDCNYRAPTIKSFLHHLCHIRDTRNFCYASYTDVPSWPCFELILPEMGRSRQKITLGTVCKHCQFIKNGISSPLLFLNEGVPCCLGCQPLALHSLNIRPKEKPTAQWKNQK